jgi:capsular exopolysaccharide synthesis family protein
LRPTVGQAIQRAETFNAGRRLRLATRPTPSNQWNDNSMLGDEFQPDPRAARQGADAAPGGDDRPGGAYGYNGADGFGGGEGSAFDLALYWGLLVKHRFLIIGSMVATLAIGVAATLLMTPIFTATATLQIDRETARVLNSEDEAPRESLLQGEEFFQTQYGLLRSRSLAERVIESLGLARSDQSLTGLGVDPDSIKGATPAARAVARREAVLEAVQANLGVSPVRGSRLVAVSYNSPDPAVSARVANAFAENFIQSNLDRKFESSTYARDFLEERLAQTKARLEDAERQLVAYAANQQIVLLDRGSGEEGEGTGESLASRNLTALNASLATATAARMQAEERWRQARSASIMSLPEVLENPTIQRLSEERAKLNSEYQQKSSTYQPEYPEMVRLKAQIDETDAQIQTIAANIRTSIQNSYVVAANQERALQRRVTGLTGDVVDLRDRSIQYNILQRELDTTRTLYEGLLQRYKEVGVAGGLTTNNISIVDTADVPARPSEPKLLVNVALALLIGLGLAIVAALVIEALDETLATPEDVEQKLGQPVLGVIPLLPKGQTAVAAFADVRSGFSEAYYSLRMALQFSTARGTPASLLVTSARPAEGKSTTSYATALNLARVGRRILLVDGDLRNPSMHRTVGVDNTRGMSNILSGANDLRSVVQPTRQENLFFIASGPLPPNPAELWASDALQKFLRQATEDFDHVIIDGPPVLGFADAPLLASAVAGTLFVLESRGTRRGQARGALRRLKLGHARLLGVALTKFNAKKTTYGGYDYAYDYHYGAPTEPAKVA